MMLMIITLLIVAGLCLGSLVNALVWRVHEQAGAGYKKGKKTRSPELSILNGRSMCPQCRHRLAAIDLVPVLSWLALGGRCRYCHKPISWQYPLVELAAAGLFMVSYIWWPETLRGVQIAIFVLWLPLVAGWLALLVYDIRWGLLPTRLIYPLTVLAAVQVGLSISIADEPLTALLNLVLAVVIGGGLFYALFQLSKGKWIGGGDIRLGWLLGLSAGTPARSLLLIFVAALLGSLVSVPLLVSGRLKRTSTIPFGPFLILAAVIVRLFGASILHWYQYGVLKIGS